MHNRLFYIFLALVYHVPQFIGRFKYLHDIGVAQVEEKMLTVDKVISEWQGM